jgi:carbon monoxide dehydrogenase subunit G
MHCRGGNPAAVRHSPGQEADDMRASVAVEIAAPRPVVWSLVTDVENAGRTISAIQSVEVLERPEEGLVGLKWREKRTLFGREATETMWISAAEEGSRYTTEARSHGSIYRTEVRVEEIPGGTRLSMDIDAEPTTTGARIASLLLGWLVRGAVRKALKQDLEEIRAAAETPRPAGLETRSGLLARLLH